MLLSPTWRSHEELGPREAESLPKATQLGTGPCKPEPQALSLSLTAHSMPSRKKERKKQNKFGNCLNREGCMCHGEGVGEILGSGDRRAQRWVTVQKDLCVQTLGRPRGLHMPAGQVLGW